jgi:hypothetical protein
MWGKKEDDMYNIKSKIVQIIFPWMVFLIVLSMYFSLNSTALATSGEGCPDSTAPTGNYQNSCNTIKCEGDTLSANCKTISGSWNKGTELDNYSSCSGEISNCDGKLRCTCGTACPSGSYNNSCFCCSISSKWNDQAQAEQKQLACWCKNKKGKYVGESKLDNYEKCNKMSDGTTYSIWNNNGYLQCNK